MGAERETLEGVTLGTVDLAVISTGPLASFFPQIECTSLPYLITDREAGWKVYDGEFGQNLGEMSESAGWKFLGWAENGLRMISNTKHEVQTPADMKGLKIRTMENDVHMQIINDLGASATPIAFSELYTALQQGTVDGQENGIALTYSMGFYEQVKYMTLLPHVYDPYIVVMSNDAWNKLPADLQELLQEEITKFCQLERDLNKSNDEAFLQKMEDAGLQVYTPTAEQTQLFKDATADVEAKVRSDVGDDLVNQFIQAANDAEASISK
jgi:C4-dicarboxylate-binding protein DctP